MTTNNNNDDIVYELTVSDLQNVSKEILARSLSTQEIATVCDSVGNYIDWFQAIEHAIHERVDQ
jgi:flagellar biosynthesis component FlhA